MEEPTPLIGTWSFERVIEDELSGEVSTASGHCELLPDGPDLIHWRERGQLRHANRELPARRDLRIERGDDGWHVKFDDGRYFHPWVIDETAVHHCGADIYEGVIALEETPGSVALWQTTWRVRGPQKDLRIRTHLQREVPLPGFETAQGGFGRGYLAS